MAEQPAAREEANDDGVLIRELQLRGFLSFGEDASPLALGRLNLLIGPNGAGKSNLIEALALLQATRGDLERVVRRGGGVREWIHAPAPATRSAKDGIATLDAVIAARSASEPALRYRLEIGAEGARMAIVDEWVEEASARDDGAPPRTFFGIVGGIARLRVGGSLREIPRSSFDATKSILAQRRDPEEYPELTDLGERLERIQLYREWQSGYTSPLRLPQRADLPNDHLLEDGSNLGLVLSRIQADHYPVWNDLRAALRDLLDGFEDVVIKAEASTVQVFLVERAGRRHPAVRLSDGTLRFLCLLAILCDPTPPPLIVIEEPELGLHADAIAIVARLLRAAAERTQLIVTTHSDALVDAFSDTPEVVVVVERDERGTQLRRLSRDALSEWLEKYRLGPLWSMGVIGGNRW